MIVAWSRTPRWCRVVASGRDDARVGSVRAPSPAREHTSGWAPPAGRGREEEEEENKRRRIEQKDDTQHTTKRETTQKETTHRTGKRNRGARRAARLHRDDVRLVVNVRALERAYAARLQRARVLQYRPLDRAVVQLGERGGARA